MAIKLLDGVDLQTIPQLSATYDIAGTVKDHCIEVYVTDGDTSITALTVDLQVRCNKSGAFISVK